jgi:hypothetical protein
MLSEMNLAMKPTASGLFVLVVDGLLWDWCAE